MQQPIIDIVPTVLANHDTDGLDALSKTLTAFNAARTGQAEYDPDFAIYVRDPETREIVGGLYATDGYGWAFIKYLVLPENYRGMGVGARLMAEAERIARDRGYVGIWLDTFEFQARPFYEKLGYTVFGALEGIPGAIPRYFLKKVF
ncbi:GNAT family N-acetyltransferase [Pararhizobium sp. BT-229]|uniref:GNAT family N-acetyltransferase n=1 Tax=Pararhizobium sp. BT-229 TaxID=2986923 RepID=UPI0021F6E304|nr:GNAT family N-acetyltransferase [Pararhizobium sp. BT-229]MCV9966539.1 GNAT family N-acetyltransferase [Pararhizobium sp. BT-229]